MKVVGTRFEKFAFTLMVFISLSFTSDKREIKKLDASKAIISEWFPHEFNLNPTSASSFKISYSSRITLNDHTLLVFGRNVLGTSPLPYSTSSQGYSYRVVDNHIEFRARNLGNTRKVPFDFFAEFRYMIIPNTEIASMTVALETLNYREITAYFNIKN